MRLITYEFYKNVCGKRDCYVNLSIMYRTISAQRVLLQLTLAVFVAQQLAREKI